jgi:hypothetical protein
MSGAKVLMGDISKYIPSFARKASREELGYMVVIIVKMILDKQK